MPREYKTIVCHCCGAPFRSRKESRFCSKSCIWKATKGPEFNRQLAARSREKIGSAQRGRGEGRAYRKYLGRHEHRVVAEGTLGRPLRRGEVVHHIDGNILNNDPANLQVMSQREHMRLHGLGIPGQSLPWKPWEHRGAK